MDSVDGIKSIMSTDKKLDCHFTTDSSSGLSIMVEGGSCAIIHIKVDADITLFIGEGSLSSIQIISPYRSI